MKITAEFNSVEEVLSFASTFGRTSLKPEQGVKIDVPVKFNPKDVHEEIETKVEKTVDVKIEAPEANQKNPEIVEITQLNPEKPEEAPKITKEMVRERLGTIMKAGKQNEVKQLVAKYGASKVPELKKEDYAAIYKEAEALL